MQMQSCAFDSPAILRHEENAQNCSPCHTAWRFKGQRQQQHNKNKILFIHTLHNHHLH